MKLCKDCETFKLYGFSPVCKWCESDGHCPECGELLKFGKNVPLVCPNGHKYNFLGKRLEK